MENSILPPAPPPLWERPPGAIKVGIPTRSATEL